MGLRDHYDALDALRQQEGEERRAAAAAAFDDARQEARRRGMALRRCTDTHYQLRSIADGWLLNLYPGNGRVYGDRNLPRAPFLNLRPGWSLIDAVRAAHRRTR